jgi:YesN/AraC family two-component response regulator
MNLHIKNMVCNRCITAVKAELQKLGLNVVAVKLGQAEIAEKALSLAQSDTLEKALQALGFEILGDKKKQLVEKIKNEIITLVHVKESGLKVNLSYYLSQQLNTEYTTLSHVFSEVEGNTIEKYFIHQKIERAKELLAYKEKSLGEIAFLLNYSSVAHLSAQFKKVTGQTPSAYKHQTARKPLNEI